uniref:Uncharacterized protein n=1 Tax=Anopheles atroparvus TaxID=41427 RepID=A0A182JL07_ANOAO
MNGDEGTILPSANSTINATSDRRDSPLQPTPLDSNSDRRNACTLPAANAGSNRGESPTPPANRDASYGSISDREFQLQRKISELERRKIELEIEIAQRELALERGNPQPVRGQQPGSVEPCVEAAMADAARVTGAVDPRMQHGEFVTGQGRPWRSSIVRFELPGAAALQRPMMAAAEQPGPSRKESHAEGPYDPDYLRFRRTVDARYGGFGTSGWEHSRTMAGDNEDTSPWDAQGTVPRSSLRRARLHE